jgi:hypothetical protein
LFGNFSSWRLHLTAAFKGELPATAILNLSQQNEIDDMEQTLSQQMEIGCFSRNWRSQPSDL